MKPQDVTPDHVIETALAWAAQFGVVAKPEDCHIWQHPTDLRIEESSGTTIVPDAVWKWDVTILATASPNPRAGRYLVPVEFLSGEVAPMDFIDVSSPMTSDEDAHVFDNSLRELAKLGAGITFSATILLDNDGYFDRLCPSAECAIEFKVLLADWTAKVSEDQAYCAFCRHAAPPSEFNTPEQQEYLTAVAIAEVIGRSNRAFRLDTDAFNRQQQGGFITLHLHHDAPAVRVPVPPAAEEAMTLRITCETCGCCYAVVGVGYFCPACGHNSADVTFDQSVDRARHAIAALPAIKAALTNKDAATQTAQSLIEGTLSNLVTAFQAFAAAVYLKLPTTAATPRRNAFQSLTEGSQLWHDAGGRAYADILDAAELADLTRLFRQRHVLQHKDGIVDQEFIDRSGDTTYALGQRLVIHERAVSHLADLLTKLVAGMRADIT